jgi:hypothetical protein
VTETLKRWGIRLTPASWWAALAGGIGAFVGLSLSSIIIGPFFDLGLHSTTSVLGAALGLAFLLMIEGAVLSSTILAVDNHQSLRGRWNRDLARGLPLFAGLAFLAGGVGQLFYSVVGLTRAIPWIMIGASVGAGIGLLRRDRTQAQRGALGGAVGGLIGGVVVDGFLLVSFTDEAFGLASEIGMVVTGAMIALFMRVVQDSLKSAWLLGVSTGPYEGKEYPLNTAHVSVGRSELNDISLYRASELAMQSGALIYENGSWSWQGEGAEINGHLQAKAALNPGDIIKLGGTRFRFQTRSAAHPLSQANVPQSLPPLASVQPTSSQSVLQPPSWTQPGQQLHTDWSGSTWVLAAADGALSIHIPPAPARLRLGRAAQNQVVIANLGVSSNHAVIELGASGLSITDLDSTNGTHINGQRVQPGVAVPLCENDRLVLGHQQYTVQRI